MMSQRVEDFATDVETLNPLERVRLTFRLLRDEQVPVWMKAAVPAIALIYLLMPIDLIPDVILGLGQIDDLSVLGISMFAMTRVLPRLAPRERVAEHLAWMRGARRHDPQRGNEPTVIETSFRVNEPGRGATEGTERSGGQRR
jgi:uncharacterized membrane protein YkvA (DUF1232 family)